MSKTYYVTGRLSIDIDVDTEIQGSQSMSREDVIERLINHLSCEIGRNMNVKTHNLEIIQFSKGVYDN